MRALIVAIGLAVGFCAIPAKRAEGGSAAKSAAPAVTETGVHDGAQYRIDIPADWNRGLVVFFHGYSISPLMFEDGERIAPMFAPLLERGFAVIQSAYTRSGWAIEDGARDSESLRKFFVGKHGAAKETFALGMSMGGMSTVMAVETVPQTYDGGLSLCGAIAPSDALLQRDFALRAAFDHYFPDMLGPLVPAPQTHRFDEESVASIEAALKRNPKAAAALHGIYGFGGVEQLAEVVSFATYEIAELQQRAHGNPFGNADLVYVDSGDDYALNDGVRRYRADRGAAAYLSRWYTPSGKLTKPLLALHTTGDPLVIASSAFDYAVIAQRAGHAANFVQQYVNVAGHCRFTPAQIGQAFDELLAWKRSGTRPASGRLP